MLDREQKASKNIVIIGGGPIGLAHAWGIKKINPSVNVTVLEKYEEYQRSHTLVMEHEALSILMAATDTQQDPALSQLLAKLKKDRHIRTNELEATFKKLAIDSGVKIEVEELKAETFESQLKKYNPDFIVGADGTHSTVSRCLFPVNNQVKIEFDFVLQFRYEIDGEKKSEQLPTSSFIQMMARHGIIANEYVGRYNSEKQKTPVTMQMMISKEAFIQLVSATSKSPIKLFDELQEKKESKDKQESTNETVTELKFDDLPEKIRGFLNHYLLQRINNSKLNKDVVDSTSVRISVNEAPATYAKQPVHFWGDIPIALVGDASLGLSYFKGLNAGLRSAAKFLNLMSPIIKKQEFNIKREIEQVFTVYSNWFINIFAPQKIQEVEKYSRWRIRVPMKLMKSMASSKNASCGEYLVGDIEIIKNFFKFVSDPSYIEEIKSSKTLYPHRSHDLVQFGQLSFVPFRYTLKKIAQLFTEYVKPYKSKFHVSKDFKQPLTGIVDAVVGAAKFIMGIITLNPKRLADGFLHLLRGTLEIATFPLAWTLKPLARGLVTIFKGKPKIEENAGMKKLAQAGLKLLSEPRAKDLDSMQKFKLLAISSDLHRKFKKSSQRGQASDIAPLGEQQIFCAAGANLDSFKNCSRLKRYFSLFADKKQLIQNNDISSVQQKRVECRQISA